MFLCVKCECSMSVYINREIFTHCENFSRVQVIGETLPDFS